MKTKIRLLAQDLLTAILAFGIVVSLLAPFRSAGAQDVTVRDLTVGEGSGPVRLMGYGIVTGLSGSGDRATGNYGSRHTVQSIVNLLRNFEIEIPAQLLRTRNVAAVLVTAEVSPYLRTGGRFDVQVSSVGDAQSLRGGVLWMTPLVSEAGGDALAGAQGNLLVTEPPGIRAISRGATSGRVPDGGILDADLPRPVLGATARLFLRQPDLGTAHRIVAAIDAALGTPGIARVEDPGAIHIAPTDTAEGLSALLARIAEVRVRVSNAARLIIDARDGTVVAGAEIAVGDGVVSAEGLVLVIGRADGVADGALADPSVMVPSAGPPGVPGNTTVADVADALRASRATAAQSSAIFLALRDAGVLRADVVVR